MVMVSSQPYMTPILKCICAGFFQNVAQKKFPEKNHAYTTLPKQEIVYIHPGSTLFKRSEPLWLIRFKYLKLLYNVKVYFAFIHRLGLIFIFFCRVVYQKIVRTSKEYMRGVTPIEVTWLKEFAPVFCNQLLRPYVTV